MKARNIPCALSPVRSKHCTGNYFHYSDMRFYHRFSVKLCLKSWSGEMFWQPYWIFSHLSPAKMQMEGSNIFEPSKCRSEGSNVIWALKCFICALLSGLCESTMSSKWIIMHINKISSQCKLINIFLCALWLTTIICLLLGAGTTGEVFHCG